MLKQKINIRSSQFGNISPLIVPFVFCVLLLFTTRQSGAQNPNESNASQILTFTDSISHWMMFKDAIIIKEPTFVKDFYPNVSRKVVSEPWKLDRVYPVIVLGQLGNDSVIPTEQEVKDSALNSVVEFITMEDVYVNNEGIVIKDNVFYPGDCDCHWQQCMNFDYGVFRKYWKFDEYDECICITHEYGWFFAHLIIDFLPRFFLVPEEVRQRSNVIVTSAFPQMIEALSLVGIKNSQIVYLEPERLIKVNTLHTVAPITCTKFYGNLLLNMRKIIADRYGLDKRPPTNYIIYNRENAQYRVITNFDEITKAIKLSFPKYRWKNFKIPSCLVDQFKYFNSIRVFIAVHGAAFANTLFMQPETVCGEVQVDRWVDNYLWTSLLTNVYHIVARDSKILWREEGGSNQLSIDMMIKLAEMALAVIGELY
jgi:capsular polysaccharide biosynthesis protein